MGRKIVLFCALIGVLAFVAGPAYAEVQNIKISGDIDYFPTGPLRPYSPTG